jgi:hypothetical protein
MSAHLQAIGLPLLEMLSSIDVASDTIARPNTPVLCKCRSARDGWLVATHLGPDLVRPSIASDIAQLTWAVLGIGIGAWLMAPVRLNYIVFDKWASGPPINGEIRVTFDFELPTVTQISTEFNFSM